MSELQSFIIRMFSAALDVASRPPIDPQVIDEILALNTGLRRARDNNNPQEQRAQERSLIDRLLSLDEEPSRVQRPRGDDVESSRRLQKRPQTDRDDPTLSQRPRKRHQSNTNEPGPSRRTRATHNLNINELSSDEELENEYSTNNPSHRQGRPTGQMPSSPDGSEDDYQPNYQTNSEDKYGHESTPEFPNGDVEYMHRESETSLETRSVGWAMIVYGHNTSCKGARQTLNKACLGIYQCPDCDYTERPRIPIGGKSKRSLPKPAKAPCKLHSRPLVHIPCEATLKVVQENGMVHLTHKGIHNHAKPRTIHSFLREASRH